MCIEDGGYSAKNANANKESFRWRYASDVLERFDFSNTTYETVRLGYLWWKKIENIETWPHVLSKPFSLFICNLHLNDCEPWLGI